MIININSSNGEQYQITITVTKINIFWCVRVEHGGAVN